jgi:hypothetical protein
MKKPSTHFDQIPIEVVKKIADRDTPKKDDRDTPEKEKGGNVIVEPASSKTEPYSMWPGSFSRT